MKQYKEKQEWKQRRAMATNELLECDKLYSFLELTTYCIDYTTHNVPYK